MMSRDFSNVFRNAVFAASVSFKQLSARYATCFLINIGNMHGDA